MYKNIFKTNLIYKFLIFMIFNDLLSIPTKQAKKKKNKNK